MDTLFIVMPAYNEEENIHRVVEEWYSLLEKGDFKSRMVIADSGSTDATHDILLEMKKTYPQLELLSS